jgi:hypothetical protein
VGLKEVEAAILKKGKPLFEKVGCTSHGENVVLV